MANLIENGEYYIFNTANPGLVLDISGSNITGTNTNLEMWTPLYNNAQAWQVKNSGTSGNTIGITSRLYGKRFGPISGTSTANVVLNASGSNVPSNVTWKVIPSGINVEVDGVRYPTYLLQASSGYYLYASGTSKGSTVRMSTSTSVYAQWAFVPINQIDKGGLFEIRSALDPMMALDVTEHGTINGSNIQIYPGTGYNNQKFAIEKRATDSYAIRAIGSGKYVDVDSAIAANGQNVAIWEDNNTRAQRWKIYEYGMTKHDGLDCMIVSFGSYVTTNADKYFIDVHAGNPAPFENVRIFQQNESNAQRFLLQPTTAEDTNMPTPYNVGVSSAVGESKRSYWYTNRDTLVPTWSCSAAWCADNGVNHYQIRYRTRTMNPNTSSWRSWSSWSEWFIPATETSGTRVWMTDDRIVSEYSWEQAKNQQIEFQVRSAGADELELLHSPASDQVVDIYRIPAISFENSASSGGHGNAWTPEGLVLEFTNDYTYGTTYLYIDSIEIVSTGESILKKPVEFTTNKINNSFVISRDNITKWIEDGTQIKINYHVGYDQQTKCGISYWATRNITYDAGSVNVEPVLSVEGSHMYARVPHLGTERMWIQVDGELFECSQVSTNSDYTVFEVLYPTNGDEFLIYTEARSQNGSKWGTDISKAHYKHISYAWTVGAKTVFLRIFKDELPVYSHSHNATYQVDILDSRKHASVSTLKTTTDDLTAYGVLVHNEKYKDDETPLDFENLTGKHAIFRDITGGVHYVVVTSVTINEYVDYDEITVQMIEESI